MQNRLATRAKITAKSKSLNCLFRLSMSALSANASGCSTCFVGQGRRGRVPAHSRDRLEQVRGCNQIAIRMAVTCEVGKMHFPALGRTLIGRPGSAKHPRATDLIRRCDGKDDSDATKRPRNLSMEAAAKTSESTSSQRSASRAVLQSNRVPLRRSFSPSVTSHPQGSFAKDRRSCLWCLGHLCREAT